MARSCGIRIGPKRYELVVLDGSPRKHRIAAFEAGEFPADVDDPVAAAAGVLKDAVKNHSVPLDQVGVAIDTGRASFRTLKLPFSDPAKIEQVLKFEVESELPQWNIDDVIVDFIPMEQDEQETSLLVSAIPKQDVEAILALTTKAGVEPFEIELEATAMVNAAMHADLCHVDDSQVLVHVGESSTSVVVVDCGQVRSMRAIHMGALSHERAPQTDPEASDEVDGESEVEGGEETPTAVAPEDPEAVRRRLDQSLSRIRRELGRTISGARTLNPIEAVYVCGLELPGMIGSTVLDVPIYVLDAFEEDSGQPADGTGPLVVAYGSALRQLGGAAVPARLRREELKFTGTFERLELPLAIACLLLATLAAVFWIFENYRYRLRYSDTISWLYNAVHRMEGDISNGAAPVMEYMDDVPAVKALAKEVGDDFWALADTEKKSDFPENSPLVQFDDLEYELGRAIGDLKKSLGQDQNTPQPQSALHGLTLVTGLIEELGEGTRGRISIRSAVATYKKQRGQSPEHVQVELDLTFFDPDTTQATRNYTAFKNALRDQVWCIEAPDESSSNLETGDGIYIDRFTVQVDVSKAVEA